MAHHFKVVTVPHVNRDGSNSKTRKDHLVYHRKRRGGYRLLAVESSRRAAQEVVDVQRQVILDEHLRHHPNDRNFQRKHGITA